MISSGNKRFSEDFGYITGILTNRLTDRYYRLGRHANKSVLDNEIFKIKFKENENIYNEFSKCVR